VTTQDGWPVGWSSVNRPAGEIKHGLRS